MSEPENLSAEDVARVHDALDRLDAWVGGPSSSRDKLAACLVRRQVSIPLALELLTADVWRHHLGTTGYMHVGRSFSGTPLEDTCPCPKEPCGLVSLARAVPECEQHPSARMKSMRQGHCESDCPGRRS